MNDVDVYKIYRQLEERQKRKYPFRFYDKDELIDKILENEDEIERLNNIIDGLEKYIKENSIYYNTSDGCQWVDQFKVLDKIEELKDSDKE